MNYKKWDNFKLHCGSIYKAISNPQNATDVTKTDLKKLEKILVKEEKNDEDLLFIEKCKVRRDTFLNPPLSQGCKSHLVERYLKEKYNFVSVASGEKFAYQLLKGVALEPLAIEVVSRVDNIEYVRQSEAKSSEFLTGKPDILCHTNNKLVDIKIVWSAASFSKLHLQKLSLQVYCQLQGYMEIYGFEQAEARYLLLNTPPYFIDQKKRDICKKFVEGTMTRNEFDEKVSEIGDFFDYEKKIQEGRRIITYSAVKDNEILDRVHKKLPFCRQFLSEFDRIFMKNNKIVTSPEDYKKNSKYPDQADENSLEHNPDVPHQGDKE
jgi:hypothetical protein